MPPNRSRTIRPARAGRFPASVYSVLSRRMHQSSRSASAVMSIGGENVGARSFLDHAVMGEMRRKSVFDCDGDRRQRPSGATRPFDNAVTGDMRRKGEAFTMKKTERTARLETDCMKPRYFPVAPAKKCAIMVAVPSTASWSASQRRKGCAWASVPGAAALFGVSPAVRLRLVSRSLPKRSFGSQRVVPSVGATGRRGRVQKQNILSKGIVKF